MIGYVMVGTNDLAKAVEFYEALFANREIIKLMEKDRLVVWGCEKGGPMFSVCTPFDGQPATIGNGGMVAFNCENSDEVKELHAKALAMGATNEGDPGSRETLYCGYCRDLDGNKLNFYCMPA